MAPRCACHTRQPPACRAGPSPKPRHLHGGRRVHSPADAARSAAWLQALPPLRAAGARRLSRATGLRPRPAGHAGCRPGCGGGCCAVHAPGGGYRDRAMRALRSGVLDGGGLPGATARRTPARNVARRCCAGATVTAHRHNNPTAAPAANGWPCAHLRARPGPRAELPVAILKAADKRCMPHRASGPTAVGRIGFPANTGKQRLRHPRRRPYIPL